jgi:hypothetical protein
MLSWVRPIEPPVRRGAARAHQLQDPEILATVEVLAIVAKSEAQSWLAQFGNLE